MSNERQVQLLVTVNARFPRSVSEYNVDSIVEEGIRQTLDKGRLSRKRCKINLQCVSVHYSRESQNGRRLSYIEEAQGDAADTVENFIDEIVEAIDRHGKADDDLMNGYCGGDSYHHENHTDKSYDLAESVQVLSDLSDFEETDRGLWEGREPKDAIEAQAAYTYGNGVYHYFQQLIEKINDAFDLLDLDDMEQEAEERRDRLEELEEQRKTDGKLSRDEYNELRRLRKSKAADSEEAIEAAKLAAIRKMVEEQIKVFRP